MSQCKLEQIYYHQNKLMNQFEMIEYANNLLETAEIPVDKDSAAGQARLRNFAGRVTEEIIEALNEPDPEKKKEELADVMHFFVELLILADLKPGAIEVLPTDDSNDRLDLLMKDDSGLRIGLDLKAGLYQTIRLLWTATNQLKQKAWKANKRESNLAEYDRLMRHAFRFFLFVVADSGVSSQEFFDLYMGKAAVNQGRIDHGV